MDLKNLRVEGEEMGIDKDQFYFYSSTCIIPISSLWTRVKCLLIVLFFRKLLALEAESTIAFTTRYGFRICVRIRAHE